MELWMMCVFFLMAGYFSNLPGTGPPKYSGSNAPTQLNIILWLFSERHLKDTRTLGKLRGSYP